MQVRVSTVAASSRHDTLHECLSLGVTRPENSQAAWGLLGAAPPKLNVKLGLKSAMALYILAHILRYI
jgi:hypothetical protein